METTAETDTKPDQPRIYVACFAAYNAGILHGAWINAARDPWSLWGDVQAMLAASPIAGAEEWAIHDVEGFGELHLAETEDLDRVAGIAAFIVEHDALGAALLDHCGGDVGEAHEALTDRYLGSHPSLADCVQQRTEETGDVPEALRFYIDWQAMARDAELNGELFALTTAWDVVHVFAGG